MDTRDLLESNLKVLVLAALEKDSEMTCTVLAQGGFLCEVVKGFEELGKKLWEDIGAIIVSEESLTPENFNFLSDSLKNQPAWSDLPIIVVTQSGSQLARSNERLEKVIYKIPNTTLLERPIRLSTLISVVRSALAARKRQYEVRGLLKSLEGARKMAEEASRTKSQFLANMSHEIRTPLGAILGFTDLMRDPRLSQAERLHYADIVARNGSQLSTIINDILDLSKIEAGHLDIEHVNVSLPSLVAESLSLLRPVAEAKGIALVVKPWKDVPEQICSDPTRIKQILINIIGNAIKFTSRGQITVSTLTQRSPESGELCIGFEIEDTGIGMSTAQQERLFRPFMQADSSTTRKYGGTGLGLMLSQSLARALGGDLILKRSESGKGSTFLATVKATPAVASLPQQGAVRCDRKNLHDHPKDKPLSGTRVLLAEDSPDNQLLIRRYLDAEGVEVKTVDNGADAVTEALESGYDLVLMDIQMPVLDGYEATRRLRTRGYKQPIIALTAHALTEEREKSFQSGLNEHLTKPINKAALVSVIEKYISCGA